MLYFLIFVIIYNILQNCFHKAIINNKNALWHILSAGIDIFLYFAIGFMIYFQILIIPHWTWIIGLMIVGLTVRLVSRDVMLGIGTTSWMDRNIKGYFRLCFDMFWLFISFVIIYQLI